MDQNELMSKKHKKVYTILNYIEHFLILASAFTGCISISYFASLPGVPIGIMSSATGLKICAITAGIKKYKNSSIRIKKKRKKHDEIVLVTKTINNVEVLISKALIDSYIKRNEFALVNNVLKEYDNIKNEIKNLKTLAV